MLNPKIRIVMVVQSFYENIGWNLKQIAIVFKLILFNFITATEKHTKSLPKSMEWNKSKFMVKYQYLLNKIKMQWMWHK